jgi:uncharacterized oxidoreductase
MAFQNNTIPITGGSSGTGHELFKVLLKNGTQVIICGRSGEKQVTIQQQSPKLITYNCDLSNRKHHMQCANQIKEN